MPTILPRIFLLYNLLNSFLLCLVPKKLRACSTYPTYSLLCAQNALDKLCSHPLLHCIVNRHRNNFVVQLCPAGYSILCYWLIYGSFFGLVEGLICYIILCDILFTCDQFYFLFYLMKNELLLYNRCTVTVLKVGSTLVWNSWTIRHAALLLMPSPSKAIINHRVNNFF